MSGQGDIRKWFMKQPPQVSPSAATATPEVNKGGDNVRGDAYKTTSKFFTSTNPASSKSVRSEDTKAPAAKPSSARGKRLNDEVNLDSDDKDLSPHSAKKPRSVEKKPKESLDESGETGKPSGSVGRGRGRGRGGRSAMSIPDEDASEPSPKAGGRGRGRGRGGHSAKSIPDEDASEPSPKAGGRGRGRGRGRGKGDGPSTVESHVSTSDKDAPEPSPKNAAGRGRGRGAAGSAQTDSKPAAAGRGRGGGRGFGGGGFYGAREPPPHKGEKEIPEGAEDALSGLTFVISGTLDSLEREEAEHLIKTHGGRVTGSVSKKTDYLLADEDVGGVKSKKAKDLGVKFLTEDGLFDMIRKTKPKSSSAAAQAPIKNEPVKAPGPISESAKPSKVDVLDRGKQKVENGNLLSEMKGKYQVAETESWPHKHRPQSINDIIGNQSIVKQVRDWLLHWEEHHGIAVTKGKKGSKSSTTTKKAVLLSGQPGIGKTTTARLVCQDLGFETLEVNASDSRGKADSSIKKGMGGSTANTIKEMVSNESLSFGAMAGRKPVLIMDEVDGMSGGDRGGVADLIASIKASRIPIICICNDKYSQKLKSLINYCLPLAFRKPTKQQMAKRLQQIAKSEGLQIDDIALEELSERVNGDMRMALNQLQYMSLRTRVVKYADMRTRLMASAKDEDISPFSAVDKLLGYEGGRLRMDERMDATMSDMDLVPLLIQENYLNYRPSAAGRDDDGSARMDLIARAATCIAEGDIVNVQIRRFRQWQHAQMGAFMSSVIPAALMHGQRERLLEGERNFNRFGGWLGKNSTFGRKLRLLEDVHVHLLASRICEPTREAVRMDYLPVLSIQLSQPLHALPKEEAVQQVVKVMEEYSLNQEDVDTILELSKFKGEGGLLDGVPAAVKTALTKAYKQHEGDRRVRAVDLLPVLTLPGFKKTPKRPSRLNFMATEDAENGESPEDVLETEEGEEEDAEAEEEPDEENGLTLLSESAPGMTVTLDTAKGKSGAGRGRGGKAKASPSQAKAPPKAKKTPEPKGTQSAKRKR